MTRPAPGPEPALDAGDHPGLACEVDGEVARVTLRQPTADEQSLEVWMALRDIGRSLPDTVRVVIVHVQGAAWIGVGGDAGGDDAVAVAAGSPIGIPGGPTLEELGAMPPAEVDRVIEWFQESVSWLGRADIVSVAVVRGHVAGAAFQLALACDLRVASDDAVFTLRDTALGCTPNLGATHALVALVGSSRALDICATGRALGVNEAGGLGLVNRVVRAVQLHAVTEELVATLLSTPRGALAATKALLLGASRHSFDEQLAAERRTQVLRVAAAGSTRDR